MAPDMLMSPSELGPRRLSTITEEFGGQSSSTIRKREDDMLELDQQLLGDNSGRNQSRLDNVNVNLEKLKYKQLRSMDDFSNMS